jgi:hypothetical protein
MTTNKDETIRLALGRIFRLASRPTQDGDVQEYERCRKIIMDLCDPVTPDWTPDYGRDSKKVLAYGMAD